MIDPMIRLIIHPITAPMIISRSPAVGRTAVTVGGAAVGAPGRRSQHQRIGRTTTRGAR
jgi:hypothetical protein